MDKLIEQISIVAHSPDWWKVLVLLIVIAFCGVTYRFTANGYSLVLKSTMDMLERLNNLFRRKK